MDLIFWERGGGLKKKKLGVPFLPATEL